MRKSLLYSLFIVFSVIEVRAAEQEAVVVEVRKSVSLSKHDKTYKNYFVNGGAMLGLSKGAIVDVLRRLPVHDPLKNSSIGDIRVKVGEVEIIHSDAKISIARLIHMEPASETRPVLDFDTVMVGDRLDLNSVRTLKPIELKVKTEAPSQDPMLGAEQVASRAQNLVKEGERNLASLSVEKPVEQKLSNKRAADKKTVEKQSDKKVIAKKAAKKSGSRGLASVSKESPSKKAMKVAKKK